MLLMSCPIHRYILFNESVFALSIWRVLLLAMTPAPVSFGGPYQEPASCPLHLSPFPPPPHFFLNNWPLMNGMPVWRSLIES